MSLTFVFLLVLIQVIIIQTTTYDGCRRLIGSSLTLAKCLGDLDEKCCYFEYQPQGATNETYKVCFKSVKASESEDC